MYATRTDFLTYARELKYISLQLSTVDFHFRIRFMFPNAEGYDSMFRLGESGTTVEQVGLSLLRYCFNVRL